MVREVFDDAQRDEFVDTVSGALGGIEHDGVLQRAFEYWKSVDAEIGKRIETAVLSARGDDDDVTGMGVE